MKALIVDDDISTVNTIYRFMQWGKLGIEQVYMAYAVAGAKEIMLKENPEIVVCDIEMPMGSGLDLLRWEREKCLGAQFVFLTCHDKFEFAAAAIQHQAAEYILKPFDPSRLAGALQTAAERISQKKQLQRDSTFWKENRKAVERDFWTNVLFLRIPGDSGAILEEASKCGVELPKQGCISIILTSVTVEGHQSPDEGKSSEHIFKMLIEKQMGESTKNLFYRNEANAFLGISIMDSSEDTGKNCLNLLKAAEKMVGCEVTCYLAETVPLEQMGVVRQQMEQMDLDNISKRGRMIRWKKYIPRKGVAKPVNLENLYPLLLGGERLKIMKMLQRQIEETALQAELTPNILYAIQQDIVQEAYVYLHKNEIRPDLLFGDGVSIQMMRDASSSKYAMMKWISYFFNRLIDFDEKRKKSESIVTQAKRYIDSNYQENISRNEVAGCVFLTPEYLGKIFKREMGVSINTYIAECRLQRAKLLLSDTQISIGQIAVEVGFNGLPYFVSSFKKKFGISPTEYRKSKEQIESI